MGIFSKNQFLTPEEKEELKGKTPYVNEKLDRKPLPMASADLNNEDQYDEGFNKLPGFASDAGGDYVGPNDIVENENYEDDLIANIDRRREQSLRDKQTHRENLAATKKKEVEVVE